MTAIGLGADCVSGVEVLFFTAIDAHDPGFGLYVSCTTMGLAGITVVCTVALTAGAVGFDACGAIG